MEVVCNMKLIAILGVCFGILRWPSECGRKERGALGSECGICLQVSCLMHSFEDPQQ